jgi:hypothetical protein
MTAPAQWRFNPPPGWPVPPQGWTPPPGWQPDPRWPPAPAGWAYWVPAQRTVVTSPIAYAPPSKPSRTLSTAVKVVVGAVTLLTALAGTWFAYKALPEAYTAEQWRQKASATCERDFADVRLSMNGVLLKVGAALAVTSQPGQVNPAMTEAANSLGELARALRRFSADLREIKVPDDLSRVDLDAYLSLTGEVTTGIEQMSNLLVQYQIGQATPAQIQQTMTTMDTMSRSTLPQWGEAGKRLGLDACMPSN